MTGIVRETAAGSIGNADRLQAENARLKAEIDRLRRVQLEYTSTADLTYILEHANCLLWHATISSSDDPIFLEWNVSPTRSDWVQNFFPLHLLPGEDYWQAFYRARLTEDLEPAGERNAAAIRAGLDYETEYRAIDASGKLRWIRESVQIETVVPGQSWRAVGICTDITAQKEMQRKLERRDELLRVAADVAGVALIVVDSELRYQYVNRKHAMFRGLADTDIVGKTVSEVFEPSYAADFISNLDRVLKGERIRRHQIFASAIENGAEQHFDVIIEPAADQSGPLAVIVLVDVTERDRIQEETKRLKIEAEKRAAILNTARQVALDILLSRSGAEVLRHIAETAQQLTGAEYAAIAIDDADEMELPHIIAAGQTVEQDAAISSPWLAERSLEFIKKHPGQVWNSTYSPSSKGASSPDHSTISGHIMGIPILRDENAIGALFIGGAPGSARFDDAAEAAVVALADYVAVAIHYLRQLEQQRSLTHRFVNLLEEERRSVAFEIHDGLTQHIMAASAFLDSYCDSQSTTNRASMNLEKGMMCLRLAVQESRRLINGLRALTLDDMGLASSLQQLLDEQAEMAGWKDAVFTHNTDGRKFGLELETAVYRIAQEALSNARKHAASDRLSMQLNESKNSNGSELLKLTVQDWGNGFDPARITTTYGHVGLQSMCERANLLCGKFSVDSALGSGTLVCAVFELVP